MSGARELMEFMRFVTREYSLLQKNQACGCGTTMAQSQALIEIGRAGEISLVELANLLGLDRSTMSRTVNKLVECGLVSRLEDREDRRYVVLRLTSGGQDTYGTIEGHVLNHYARVLNEIPAEKQGQVLESLALLEGALRKRICSCGNPDCTCGCQD